MMTTMMNSNMKRNRGGRTNPGGRNDKRSIYNQDRPGGVRQRTTPDKNTPISYDGVYKNSRFTHVIYSLVGSNVQVQVKNGIVYEGVLKTFSPKGDVVLELAHMVDDNTNSSNSLSSAPSRERLMEKLIIKPHDLIMVNVTNVDLDYAVKDSFTDAGISKYNGEINEKAMKELEPWVGEGEHEIGGLESEKSSNGWDPNEMFRRNAENFNVKSSYDDSLAQYTTKLEVRDTEEYRRREERASALAAEIEETPTYKKHIALENGEGDMDEETRFSAVVRVTEQNNNTQQPAAPFVQSSGGSGKYVPPNKRNGPGSMMSRPARGGYHPGVGRNPPGHPPTPPTSQQQQHQPVQPVQVVPVHQAPPPSQPPSHQAPPTLHQGPPPSHQAPPPSHQAPPTSHQGQPHTGPPPTSTQGQSTVKTPPRLEPLKVNGEPSPIPSVSTASPTVKVASPISEQHSSPQTTDNRQNPLSPGTNKHPQDNRKTGKGREQQIEAFKQFSDTIKLDHKKEKDKSQQESHSESSEHQETTNVDTSNKRFELPPSQQQQQQAKSEEPQSSTQYSQDPGSPQARGETEVQSPQKTEASPATELSRPPTEEPKKSLLNPLATEFVPTAKPLPQTQPVVQPQAPTPPHPQTQSPIAIQQPMMNIPQPMIAAGPGQFFVPQPNVLLNSIPQTQPQLQRTAKRAVVSVKPENAAAAVQAAAATGQPIIQQSAPQNFVYMQQFPQPSYHPQMGQVMPMPPTNPRHQYMPAGSAGSMPGMVPTSHQAPVEQNNQTQTPAQTGPIFMQTPQGGPMPAHITHTQPTHLPHPSHIPHHQMSNPQAQQPSTQMNPQSHHPPAPSPVHTTNPTGQQQPLNHTQGHPPSSGTPQPPQAGGYPQATLQPRPPLQPSPHNPSSPQNLPTMHYPFNSSHNHPMQMGQGGPQFSMTQPHSSVPSSVTYSMQTHGHHSPHIQPQIVMMPPHPGTGQMQHPQIHTTQFQGHPMAGPGSVYGQAQMMPGATATGLGVQGLTGANSQGGGHPPTQMQQYLPQVHSQNVQPVQQYQQPQ